MAEKSRKKTSKHIFGKFILFLIFVFAVWWFNNYTLKTVETSTVTPKVSKPVCLAVISDLHAHKYSISNSAVMKRIEKISPDAVIVLGDMYSRKSPQSEINIAVELMADIAGKYETYFVSGDHDTSEDYFTSLRNSGVHVMNYKEEYTEINGNTIQIMGIDNVYYTDTFNLDNEFKVNQDCLSILLAHIPNYQKFADFGADLTLCADTHGGMVRLPFIGALFDALNGKFFPTLRKNYVVYDKGWFEYNGGAMFITSGIGDSPVPLRFCNRPEVVRIDILPAGGD
ncbi:MAG: metallophosphoesterase [Ruminococcus sp.]|nr:metallophosphoesterase [Ruminococcus sp.]MDE7225401.1 metallophosphoesterase [Ruminococcus sp.]